MDEIRNFVWIFAELDYVLGVDDLKQPTHRVFGFLMLLLNVDGRPESPHLLVVLKCLEQEGFGWSSNVVSLQLLTGDVEVFEEKDDLARVDVCLLEPVDNLGVIHRVHQHHPTRVQVEHLESLHVVFSALVAACEEYFTCFSNAVRIQQLIDLLLPADLFQHIDFGLDSTLLLNLVSGEQVHVADRVVCIGLHIDGCVLKLELQGPILPFDVGIGLQKITSARVINVDRSLVHRNDVLVLDQQDADQWLARFQTELRALLQRSLNFRLDKLRLLALVQHDEALILEYGHHWIVCKCVNTFMSSYL